MCVFFRPGFYISARRKRGGTALLGEEQCRRPARWRADPPGTELSRGFKDDSVGGLLPLKARRSKRKHATRSSAYEPETRVSHSYGAPAVPCFGNGQRSGCEL